jgi:hypothetical protein
LPFFSQWSLYAFMACGSIRSAAITERMEEGGQTHLVGGGATDDLVRELGLVVRALELGVRLALVGVCERRIRSGVGMGTGRGAAHRERRGLQDVSDRVEPCRGA